MKKLFFIISLFSSVFSSQAQDAVFLLNANGECEIVDTLKTELPQGKSYAICKDWAFKNLTSPIFKDDVKGKSLKVSANFNIKKAYNPFAGTFVENLLFDCDFICEDGYVIYRMYNFQIQNMYFGYGMQNSTYSLVAKLEELDNLKNTLIDDKTISSKEKKEVNSKIKDIEDSIKKATIVMNKKLKLLQTKIIGSK